MLYIILTIFIIILIIKKRKSPYGVVLYFANVGSGKTTLLSRYAQKEIKLMKKGKSSFKYIISNAQISGVKYVPNIRDIIKKEALKDTLILLDEASIVYNNRKLTMTESEIQYFKLIRHYNSCAIVVSQSYNDIDVTLRRLYTKIYLLNYMPYFTLIRPIKKIVGIDEVTHDIVDMYKFKFPLSWRIILRPLYFKYFNSWWIPSDVLIADLEKYQEIPYSEYKPLNKRIFKEKDIQKLIKPKQEK